MRVRSMAAGALLGVAVAACAGQSQAEDAAPAGPRVVATHSILADIVEGVVDGERSVETVIPAGADAHEFEPSPQQIELLGSAELVIANGLGFEESLSEALDAAEADGVRVLSLGEQLDPLGEDPHWFQDPDRAAQAARLIGEELGVEGGQAYGAELEALAAELQGQLAGIPASDRRLVTNHDALGYFADRFDFTVVGSVIPGGTTLAEPSAADLEELAGTMRRQGVQAIFAEVAEPARLAEALAAELGGDVEVVELFTDTLGEPGSGGATYQEMMRTNAERISGALAS